MELNNYYDTVWLMFSLMLMLISNSYFDLEYFSFICLYMHDAKKPPFGNSRMVAEWLEGMLVVPA